MMTVEQAYQYLYFAALIALALLIGVMIVRSFIGPRILDRILSINMIGTLVITSLAISSRLLGESYLIDIALIYAMISLLSVLLLSSIYLPKKLSEEEPDGSALNEAAAKDKSETQTQKDRGAGGVPGSDARKGRHVKKGPGKRGGEMRLPADGEEEER